MSRWRFSPQWLSDRLKSLRRDSFASVAGVAETDRLPGALMSTRWRWWPALGFALVIGLGALSFLIWWISQPAPPIRALLLNAPTQIRAGDVLTITVQVTPATAKAPVLLLARGTFGLYPQRQMPVNGRARFTLTASQTRFAGAVQLMAQTTTLTSPVTVTRTTTIVPGQAVDPILPLVGPRSIVADGKHWTMVVSMPRDAFLNPVAENSVVTVRAQHPVAPSSDPTTGLEIAQLRTNHLLAWVRLYSRTRAGRTLIAATSGDAHSPERTLLELPGLPVPFALTADRLTLPADGRQLVQLQSEQIKDQFGNVLLDGADVTLLADMAGADRRALPAQTLAGRIDTTLQAPTQPGRMIVRAWVAGVASQPLTLTFTPGPAVASIPLTIQTAATMFYLRAGPLVGQLGQFVPDGTVVTFQLTKPDKQVETFDVQTDYGYAMVNLRKATLLPGAYQLHVSAGTGAGQLSFHVP